MLAAFDPAALPREPTRWSHGTRRLTPLHGRCSSGANRSGRGSSGCWATPGTAESGALLLVGEAGIGKTALLEHARADAAAAGMPVLRARGMQTETDIPFAGL